MGTPSGQTLKKARGWVTRRIVGYIIFAIVSAILTGIAVSQGFLTGGPTFQTVCGAFILAVSFLVSFALTTRMKERGTARMEREEWERAWKEYYARQAQQVQLAWQQYYARQRQAAQPAQQPPAQRPPAQPDTQAQRAQPRRATPPL